MTCTFIFSIWTVSSSCFGRCLFYVSPTNFILANIFLVFFFYHVDSFCRGNGGVRARMNWDIWYSSIGDVVETGSLTRTCVRYVLGITSFISCRTWLFSNKYVLEHNFSVSWVREAIFREETYIYLTTIYTSDF